MRLSICIPTYNRADYLPALFDSILAQDGYGCELEVAVSDNGSTDDTAQVIEGYRSRFDRFVYHREAVNRGPDRNFLKAIEIGSGEFCWLMGSDDVLEEGGLSRVEAALIANPDIAGLAVKNTSYDIDMQSQIISVVESDLPLDSTIMNGSDEIFRSIGEYISFISANVVRRDLWMEATREEGLETYFNAWIHVYVMGRMMQRQPRWGYISKPCVAWRAGNDSFLADGQYRRLEIDVAGYERILNGLFGDKSPVYRYIMRRILNHARFRIVHAKVHDAPAMFFDKVRVLMNRYYRSYPAYWLTTYPLLGVPAPIFKVAREVYARTVKPVRLARRNR